MERLNLKLILLTITLSFCQLSFSQKTGKIKGIIADEKGVLEFVNVNLKKTTDTTKIIGYATSDANGSFTLDTIANGDYTIQFKMIGYKTYSKKVTISDVNSPLLLAIRPNWKLCSANNKARAFPIPLDAPVMIATGGFCDMVLFFF